MSSIITAKATFTPGDTRHLLDLYVQVRLFAKVQAAQAVVVEEAKGLVPVASGTLQGSIHAGEPVNENNQIRGPVFASAPYASFVEFGTGVIGSGTYPYDLPQEGVPITGSWIYDYKAQNWQGGPARPFMRPALDNARSRVLSEFAQS